VSESSLSPLVLLHLSMLYLLVFLEKLEDEHVCKLRRTRDPHHWGHSQSRNSSFYLISHHLIKLKLLIILPNKLVSVQFWL